MRAPNPLETPLVVSPTGISDIAGLIAHPGFLTVLRFVVPPVVVALAYAVGAALGQGRRSK